MQETVALVTGSDRGVGRALVEALLDRGARRAYAVARDLFTLDPVVALDRSRVVPLRIDVRERGQIAAAAQAAGDVTLLVKQRRDPRRRCRPGVREGERASGTC
jgi:NAD(P)-dependent dehydrogenase (short-subunit alcohol dehydrogenase family)